MASGVPELGVRIFELIYIEFGGLFICYDACVTLQLSRLDVLVSQPTSVLNFPICIVYNWTYVILFYFFRLYFIYMLHIYML